ncbi:MAG: NAD(P)/FAD-dependent oxidoreductase [Phycisphaeraceae bacterium]
MTSKADWNVAIIGAGMAGASAGQALAKQGASVAIFDKGRGPGGRCATRRHDAYCFDHGAQYFTARDPRFRKQVAAWAKSGAAAHWRPRIGQLSASQFEPIRRRDLWVGTPGMAGLSRAMLDGLDVRFDAQIRTIERAEERWAVVEASGETHIGFDQLLVTAPAPQVGPLLGDHFSAATDAANNATMLPCWTLMLAFDKQIELPFDAAKVVSKGPISWLARNSSKPGRSDSGMDCWVVQADHAWSRDHAELSRQQATGSLLSDFATICEACGVPVAGPSHTAAHRWRYALATPDTTHGGVLNADTGLAVAGDWLSGGRIESAWLSGLLAAERLIAAWPEQTRAMAGVESP